MDPHTNIRVGIQYHKDVLDMVGGDYVLAVAGYNAGHGRVLKLGRIPNYRETVDYVTKVFHTYEELTGRRHDYTRHMTPWARNRSAALREKLG